MILNRQNKSIKHSFGKNTFKNHMELQRLKHLLLVNSNDPAAEPKEYTLNTFKPKECLRFHNIQNPHILHDIETVKVKAHCT